MVFRRGAIELEVLLAHPGGPYFAKKDEGAWTLPKGELEPGETLRACAQREFREEVAAEVDSAGWIALGHIVQKGGKRVTAWAVEADLGEVSPAIRC